MSGLPSRLLVVRSTTASADRGFLEHAGLRWPCRLGRTGRRVGKREGDGATPVGRWPLTEVLYRRDRVLPPSVDLARRAIRATDGWCDASTDRNYNRPIVHPYPESAEYLWRQDGLYDVVVILDYNRRPRRRGAGSAIFMHLMHPAGTPTAGCIALSRRDLGIVLGRISRGAVLVVPA